MPDDNDSSANPRPSRRRLRRRRVLPYPVRLAFVAAVGTLGAVGLFRFTVKVVHPYLLGHEEGRKVAVLRTRLAAINTSNDALRSRIAYLRTPDGSESEARRAGYHLPGETVYLMNRDALPAPAAASGRP